MSRSRIPVLLLVRELNLGGIERDVAKAARYLPEYGIEPHVACFREGGMRWKEIEAAGAPLLHLPVTSLKNLGAIEQARRLYRYLIQQDIQVVHAYEPATSVFGIPVARAARVPASLASRLCYPELNPPELRRVLEWTECLATGIFVNCNAVGRHLSEHEHVAPNRIHVCHNGFDPAEFYPGERREHQELVIGTVAVLREEKNLQALLEAFAATKPYRAGVRLLIVGSGEMRAQLERRIAELGIADSVTMQPATATPAEWMRQMDIYVLPSRSESFPNALLEAMACGCCPVASDVGGVPELIAHAERGFLFEKGNAQKLAQVLLQITEDRALVRRMGTAAAAFARANFTMDVAAARLAGIYRALLNRSNLRHQQMNDEQRHQVHDA